MPPLLPVLTATLVALIVAPASADGGDAALAVAPDHGGVYFPLRAVELKLWVDGKSGNLLPPPGGVLFSPRLVGDAGQAVDAPATYRLTTTPGHDLGWLSVDAKTGTLTVKEERVLSDSGAQRQHVVWLEVRVPAAPAAPLHRSARPFMVPGDRARINITITLDVLQEGRPCANKPEEATAPSAPCHYCTCFWLSAEVQVWENKPATMLAPLGHRYAQCGENEYTLLNATEHVEIRGGALWSRADLDRDFVANASVGKRGPGPHLDVGVLCKTPWGSNETRTLHVHVLDEDDSAPVLEKDDNDQGLVFNFSSEAALARGAHILVKDMDSRAANRFGEMQVVDPSGVVTHKKLEFDVTHGGVQHTLVSIRLQVKDPLDESYNVSVTLTDLTLREGMVKELRMNATLRGPPLSPPVAMSSSRTRRDSGQPATTTTDHDVEVWAFASRFARILQLGAEDDGRAYRLWKNTMTASFGVTPRGGIVYVADPGRLQDLDRSETHTLQIQSAPKNSRQDAIRIHNVSVGITIINGQSHQCLKQDRSCASYSTLKTCVSGCGLGSGGTNSGPQGKCVWRAGFASSNQVMTRNYSTCTPQEDTCPDGVCDALEDMDHLICPQDCTGAS